MSHFSGDLTITAIDGPTPLWRATGALSFTMGAMSPITIPDGFVCDLASVPAAVKGYIDDDSPQILKPAVIHDYLYSLRGQLPDGRLLSRQECDEVLREGMLVRGARRGQAAVVYVAVRAFGGAHWNPKKP